MLRTKTILLCGIAAAAGLVATSAVQASQTLYVANSSGSSQVLAYDASGNATVFADSSDSLFGVRALAFDSSGVLYVANSNKTIQTYDGPHNESLFADSTAGIDDPHDLAFDSAGNLYVTEYAHDKILKFASNGDVSTFADNTDGLDDPVGLAFDDAGNLYVANQHNGDVLKFNPTGTSVTTFIDGLTTPTGLVFDDAGNLYVSSANSNVNKIWRFDSAGGNQTTFADSDDYLSIPEGMAFDDAGNLYVANYFSDDIVKIDPEGVGTVFANTNGTSYDPRDVAFSVPEPATFALIGLGGLLMLPRRRSCDS